MIVISVLGRQRKAEPQGLLATLTNLISEFQANESHCLKQYGRCPKE